MTNSCRTCRDLGCPNVGQDRAACEDHTSIVEKHAESTPYIPDVEQRVENLQARINALTLRLEEIEEWIADLQAFFLRKAQGLR